MDAHLRRAVELDLEASGRPRARIERVRPVGGGSIHHAELATLADGARVFVKSNPSPLPGIFVSEAEGLEALRAADVIRVPEVLAVGDGPHAYLVMEAIETGSPGPRFFEDFGERFARLHRETSARGFGFAHDGYIGATPQPNPWTDDWCAFWREHRLGHQLRLARRASLSDASLDRLGDRLLGRLGDFIAAPNEPPCLLHGDLWSGNYLSDASGAPVLIDPAAYYGRREADIAMTRVFGGFGAAFYEAYERTWPLEAGSDERLAIYELYHLLNHLNLFGRGYRAGCVAILERLVG